jgi:hypothetical protein
MLFNTTFDIIASFAFAIFSASVYLLFQSAILLVPFGSSTTLSYCLIGSGVGLGFAVLWMLWKWNDLKKAEIVRWYLYLMFFNLAAVATLITFSVFFIKSDTVDAVDKIDIVFGIILPAIHGLVAAVLLWRYIVARRQENVSSSSTV